MMKVAKVLIIDEQDQYLMLWRSGHPELPNDPDLPGGVLEEGEEPAFAAVREVEEESGMTILEEDLELLYQGSEYSKHGTVKSLYVTRINPRQEVVISWEHSAYEWVSRDTFLDLAKSAKDTYMHMVHDVVSKKSF